MGESWIDWCGCSTKQTPTYLPTQPKKQGVDHGEAVKSVLQQGFLGRDTEQLFPYGIYTCVHLAVLTDGGRRETRRPRVYACCAAAPAVLSSITNPPHAIHPKPCPRFLSNQHPRDLDDRQDGGAAHGGEGPL